MIDVRIIMELLNIYVLSIKINTIKYVTQKPFKRGNHRKRASEDFNHHIVKRKRIARILF
jgi:hypothetical protein